ncbi:MULTISPECIES: PDR/VanB family oxidoreductase [Nocardioides]|uniref:PDR/VanB family oxidoreductase n=1 Tax=Nocardioides vastitatis TaxID=2568655 RepID=A0ABW0ZM72_9ACTN|nr:PDR/VanB family oxidoreductase [Nocardioides sp.]THJ02051.1 oxidoreductase [Nocardioides sp.]
MTLTTDVDLTTHRFHAHDAYRTSARMMRVTEVRPLTAQITHLRFVPADGGPLTAYQPGSHLVVTAGTTRNAYSLVDDGINPSSYGISVMRRGRGGGSDWLHDHVAPGDLVEVEGPRSMFAPVLNQRHALLVAGGIGVTPVLSHARAIARLGGSAEILYSYRSGHAAHLEDLHALAETHDSVTLREATTVEATVAMLTARFADQPLGTHAYACGPLPLLETYQELAAAAGWPPTRVHLERFSAPEQDPGSPFTAIVASTGQRLEVAPGVSLLTALLDAGLPVPNLCRQGVCGECRISVRTPRAGSIEHRDLVLSDHDRASGDILLCCVSRGVEHSEIEVLL